jgi:hypothetical protein
METAFGAIRPLILSSNCLAVLDLLHLLKQMTIFETPPEMQLNCQLQADRPPFH